jgi:hypothetical protein
MQQPVTEFDAKDTRLCMLAALLIASIAVSLIYYLV